MEDKEKKERKERDEIFSKAVRAGKRTYFFDVKATRAEDQYLTITESKRRFSNEQGKFFYEKHKIFLYKEDFEKFTKGLSDSIQFITTGIRPEPEPDEFSTDETPFSDVDFDDLENTKKDDE